MNEYCDQCGHQSAAVSPCVPCQKCGHHSVSPDGPILTIRQALREISRLEHGDGQTDRSMSLLRRYARETVRAGWAKNYRRAVQMKGQDWGIRVVW